jgi:tRNA A-37 threonylcarbamoyl transferase component Bud32/uncharacterized cupredoxin-like copper-binding protein
MKKLLLIFFAAVLLPSTDAITLYNATEWKSITSFSGTNGQTYSIYKPVCTGRYKLGDLIIPNTLNVELLPSYLVCADGDSNEITEASSANLVQATTAAFFNEHQMRNGVQYNVTGIVAMDRTLWNINKNGFQGSTSGWNNLRGYGALLHPNCQLTACSGTTVTTATGQITTVSIFNALSPFFLPGGESMPLFRVTGDNTGMQPFCLTPGCLCPDCVHGTCNPLTSKCACDPEWRGTNCDTDVDECERHTANCDPIATCINQSPGYTCVCPTGYNTTDGGVTCNDIDECSFAGVCPDAQLCVNYNGGFECNNCSAGQVIVEGSCVDVTEVFKCGNAVLDAKEACDRGIGCAANCTCNTGFSSQNSTDCIPNCGNDSLDDNEECDGGLGCMSVCLCDVGYYSQNSTACAAEVFIETDPCARFSSNCSDCLAFSCLYCQTMSTCSRSRIASDCLDTCPSSGNATVIPDVPAEGVVTNEDAMVRTIVPAVVVSVSVVVAGVVVLVELLKRRNKKKSRSAHTTVNLSRMSSRRRSTGPTSKYGIERNILNANPDSNWEAPADYEFIPETDLPFEMSKKLDFNVGSNQFKVGQQYTDVVVVAMKDKKSSTTSSMTFEFHPPTSRKVKIAFNPSSGIVKKGKPVEVEVTMTMQMTTEIDVDIGLECSSEKKHSFITLHLMSELSSFIDLEEVALEGGSSAKPVGDGAFGVVYKGTYRGQDVAVKMLKMQDMPEEMLDEFDREVDLMNKLRHKNIVQFIGASKVVGRFALITEFVQNGNVSQYVMKASKVNYSLKLRVALDTAQAMLFLHENHILHRDLKLDNLLCVSTDPDDPVVAKLTDFGTSRAVSEKNSNSYTVGIGTPIYMAPEILAKNPYDTKCDVYSYGVMLWVLYCQKEPYQHIEHSWEIARFIIEGNREKVPKDCPAEYAHLIEECWAQDPDQRPDFQHIVERLEKMLHDNTENPMLSRSRRK